MSYLFYEMIFLGSTGQDDQLFGQIFSLLLLLIMIINESNQITITHFPYPNLK